MFVNDSRKKKIQIWILKIIQLVSILRKKP